MPTFERTTGFAKDYQLLEPAERQRFKRTVLEQFVPDLVAGRFRAGLRVKRVRGTQNVWELTWAPDGRATWQYGTEQHSGDPHVIWRRVGTHDVIRNP